MMVNTSSAIGWVYSLGDHCTLSGLLLSSAELCQLNETLLEKSGYLAHSGKCWLSENLKNDSTFRS